RLELQHLQDYPALCPLLHAAAAACPHLLSLTLRHCCTAGSSQARAGPGSGEGSNSLGAVGAGVGGLVGAVEVDGGEEGQANAQAAAACIATGFARLVDVELEGGDFALVSLVSSIPGTYTRLTLSQCDLLVEEDLLAALAIRRAAHKTAAARSTALCVNGASVNYVPLRELQVFDCRHIDGAALELRAGDSSLQVVCTDWSNSRNLID
ncbi:hypothetical protein QJQ45_023978, partial [Haematococcus lacustris]